ncbi:Legume-like lectin family protein [Tritrichomonas foetus]|uniref:Legume-like lectin family protein n=1 Tax=Tritrichomonas foetus TaxID=1144522 RepID=A0A1J4KPA7_9EUKA|nr:Legume-like lectin family protein [Tritrichomonas foetus]|eukprot:OHT11261.1 Legume-like lectin family protein [Tritrichomonas foetus]
MISFLSFFITSSFALETRYSLVPPFEFTNISEIGNWTLRGSAANLKKYLRLTSTIDGDFGSVCQRVPTLFKDWQFETEVKANNNRHRGGEGFWFYFTDEVCPDMLLQFTGFAIWINTTKTSPDGLSPIYFVHNENQVIDFDKYTPLAYIKIRNSTNPVRIRITKKGETIRLEKSENIGEYSEAFHLTQKGLLKYGYFTLASITGSTSGFDNNDLYAIRTFALGPYDQKEFDYDISTKNRKIIEDAVDIRRSMKEERRSKMVNMNKYNEDATKHQNKLTGKEKYDLKDAFNLIREAELRGMKTVTIDELKSFINSYIETTIAKAMKKIDMAFEKFDETKLDMNELWGYLRSQLLDLGMETKQSLKKLEAECLTAAKTMKLENLNQETLQKSVDQATGTASDSTVSKVLMYIMAVEVVAYVIFFVYKRQKTHGFIKVD